MAFKDIIIMISQYNMETCYKVMTFRETLEEIEVHTKETFLTGIRAYLAFKTILEMIRGATSALPSFYDCLPMRSLMHILFIWHAMKGYT